MTNLDSLEEIKKLDKGMALESVEKFPMQCRQAFDEAGVITVPEDYKNAKNVVIVGMGGSAYAARIVKSLFLTKLTKPVELVTGYDLPSYVNNDTLVFLSSFSGTTEETLTSGEKAKGKGAKIAGITSGGKLAEFFKGNNYPAYIFSPKHNPSNQPRLGQGYMVTGTLMLLRSLGVIDFTDSQMLGAIDYIKVNGKRFIQTVKVNNNPAKKIAYDFIDRYPVLFCGDIYEGALHGVRNPFNETAKQFAAYFSIPELNHHLMEGFSYPEDNKDKLYTVIFESDLYAPKIKKRIEITKDVLKQNNLLFTNYKLQGGSELAQMLELLQWGGFVTYYLGMLNGIDPGKVPWVDYFKQQLAK
ncbi:bifunctional phosphoglucose/phosphomannose isomerase [Candidatus Gottesmanbacteria bacterium]|nr:bifunctional phosphoglucose/phosphomannose isomerase [Candidatus Gottesmanbacteria bacterium]